MASAELSRTGARTTAAPTVSLNGAVQAMTSGAVDISGNYGETRNLPRDPYDNSPFGPLWPLLVQAINPPRKDTGQPEPRVWEYPTGFNLPGGEHLLDWKILRDASVNVDVIRRCIEIRKDDVRALDWSWVVGEDAIKAAQQADPTKPREDIETELREKYAADIGRLTTFWTRPWITNGVRFGQWVAAVMEDHIVLDAVAVYPVVSLGGDVIAFRLVDGSTIKLLINEYGERPQPPFPAFQQNIYGFPRGEYIADMVTDEQGNEDVAPGFTSAQLTYWRENFRTNTPYGLSQVEQALISAALYLKRQGWMHAEYDTGSTPMTWLVPQGDKFTATQLAPTQRREYEQAINDDMSGQTSARQRIKISYPGFNPVQMDSVDERYKPDYDLHLVKMVIGHLGVTSDRFGLTETKGLGATGQHERQAEVQDDSGVNPDVAMLQDLIMDLSRNYLNAPLELQFAFTTAKNDDAAAEDQVADTQLKRGSLTLNEDRRRLGRPAYTFPEADSPAFFGASGPVYLEGGLERQQAAQEQQAMMADAKANPPGPGAPGPSGGGRPGPVGGGGPDGFKPKPTAPSGGAGAKPKNKAAAYAEVVAYGRWVRKQAPRGLPTRPFRFEHATPDDLAVRADFVLDGRFQEFEGYEWRADITKDWRSWNAEHPLHPRGPHGRFVKVGELIEDLKRHHGEVGELHENAFDEAVRRAHAGRHVKRGESALADDLERRGLLEELGGAGKDKGRLSVSEAGRRHIQAREAGAPSAPAASPEPQAPDVVQLARERQARIDRARSIAELGAEVDELRGNEADLPVAQRRVAAMAAREPDNAELQAMAADLAGADSLERMHEIAGRHLERHGIASDEQAGTVLSFDRSRHRLIGGGNAGHVAVVRPGHTYVDDSGEQVRLSHAMVEEATPDEVPSPVETSQPLRGGESGDVQLVTRADGTQVVRKKIRSARGDRPAKTQADAEQLGAQVAQALGVRTPAVTRVSGDTVETEYLPGQSARDVYGKGVPSDILASDEGVRLGLLDRITGNSDRHAGNWMVSDQGIAAIDNGMMFDYGTAGHNPFGNAHFDLDAPNALTAVDAAELRPRLEALKPQFEAMGRGKWHRQMMQEFDQVAGAASGERNLYAKAPEAPAVAAPSENALGQSAADRLRQAEVMYGPDRSTWPARAKRDAQRLERQAARERRAEASTALGVPAAAEPPVESPGHSPEIPGIVEPMTDTPNPSDYGNFPPTGDAVWARREIERPKRYPVATDPDNIKPGEVFPVGAYGWADVTRGPGTTRLTRNTIQIIDENGRKREYSLALAREAIARDRAERAWRAAGGTEAGWRAHEAAQQGAPALVEPKRFTADQLRELGPMGSTRERIIEHGRAHGLSESDIDAELGRMNATRGRAPGEPITLAPVHLAREREREEHAAYLREKTPQILETALGDGPTAITHKPSREILAGLRDQGWMLSDVNRNARTMTFASPDGEKHLTMQIVANGKTPTWYSGRSKLTLRRANEIVGVRAPAQSAERLLRDVGDRHPDAIPRTVAEHHEALDRMATREEAAAYLSKIKGADLRDLVRDFSLQHHRTTAAQRAAIVEHTVGARLNSEAIRRGIEEPHGPGTGVPAARRLADLRSQMRMAERESTRGGSSLSERMAARERMHALEEQIRAIQYPDRPAGPPQRTEREIQRDIGTVAGSHSPTAVQVSRSLHEELAASRVTALDPNRSIDEMRSTDADLTPAQREILADLEGRRADAEFEAVTAVPTASGDTSAELIGGVLDSVGSREQARAYLDNLKLTRAQLLQLARDLKVPPRSGARKDDITAHIVNATTGSRLTHDAILGAPSARRAGVPELRPAEAPSLQERIDFLAGMGDERDRKNRGSFRSYFQGVSDAEMVDLARHIGSRASTPQGRREAVESHILNIQAERGRARQAAAAQRAAAREAVDVPRGRHGVGSPQAQNKAAGPDEQGKA